MTNVVGFLALFRKEVHRFIKVINQTLLAPVISALLYITVFGVFIGSRIGEISGVSYLTFIIPGLVMMNTMTNAFMNNSTSIVMAKFFGSIQEMLTAPLSYREMALALTLAGAVRGMVVGLVTLAIALLFAPLSMHNIAAFAYFMVFVSMIFSSVGILIGLWAEKFDHIAAFSNFLITPLTFLGGVFYSIHLLPDTLQTISVWNPLLYMIDGLRFGMLGMSDVNVLFSAALVFILAAVFFAATVVAIRRGYNLRT